MKKFLSLVLALVLVLSVSVVAFADDEQEITFTKNYTLVGEGTSPAETFTFKIAKVKVEDAAVDVTVDNMPVPTISNAVFAKGGAIADGGKQTVTVTLPEYKGVGMYYYTIEEDAGDTAGVDYCEDTLDLIVMVTQDQNDPEKLIRNAYLQKEGAKVEAIDNTYSAGSLTFSKTVTGNMGDLTKYFDFTVKLTGVSGEDYTDLEPFAYNSTELTGTKPADGFVLGENKISLKSGDTVKIENLPYGVSYEITEADYSEDGYETTFTGDEAKGTIEKDNDAVEVSVENKKDVEVPTGIALDSLPYVLMIAVAAIGMVAVIARKRLVRE